MSRWIACPIRASTLAWFTGVVLCSSIWGQDGEPSGRPVYRGARDAGADCRRANRRPAPTSGRGPAAEATPAASPPLGPPIELLDTVHGEHPLLPIIRWLKKCKERIEKHQDYSATLAKRERFDGALGEHEIMFVKVRHEPFSVYVRFIGPKRLKGQEAIYVKGKYDKVVHHLVGETKIFSHLYLDPQGAPAMQDNREAITQLGLLRMTERLIEVLTHDAQFGECTVQIKPHAKIDKRDCTLIEVEHPVRREEFLCHRARIYVDSVHDMPLRYEAFDWPAEARGAPVLIEEYT